MIPIDSENDTDTPAPNSIGNLSDPVFDDLARLAARLCSAPMAILAFADQEYFRIKARVGLEIADLPRKNGLCDRTLAQEGLLKVRILPADPQTAEEPLLQAVPSLRFYAGMPLKTPGGLAVGVLGLLDNRDRDLTSAQELALASVTRQIQAQVELRSSLPGPAQAGSETELQTARPAPVSREKQEHPLIPDAMMRFSRDLRVLYAGPSIEDVLGLRSAQLLSRTLSSAGLPDALAELWEAALRRVLQNRQTEEIEFIGGRESERAFQTRCFAELSGDAVSTILTITRDITGRRQEEADLKSQAASLKKALQEAEKTAQRSSELIASFTHELRTPLNGVLGMTHLLLDTELTPAQRELAEMARTSAQAMLAVINDTLDLSRLEAGHLPLNATAFDLRDVVEEVGEILAVRAEVKGLNLILRCAPNLPQRLMGDAVRLRQALLSLADNAVKYTAQGYVLIDACCAEVNEQTAVIRLEVEDSGIGIAPEYQKEIFERYVRVASDSAAPSSGAGLGLTICRRIIEQMGGSIEVSSAPEAGSRFRLQVNLPVEDISAPMYPLALTGVRVLIVEGPRLQQYALQELLTSWGMRSSLCSSAEEFEAALRSGLNAGDPYQFALLDETMISEDHRKWLAAAQIAPDLQDTRLVLLTSVSRLARAQQLLSLGFAACLAKPARQAKLRESLLALLETPVPPVTALPLSADPAMEAEEESSVLQEQETVVASEPEMREMVEEPIETLVHLELSQDTPQATTALDRAALLARIAGDSGELRSLTGAFQVDSARLLIQIREAITLGDRYEFLDLTHKLRGILEGVTGKEALESLHRLEATASEGRPADAEAMLPVLSEALSRLHTALIALIQELD